MKALTIGIAVLLATSAFAQTHYHRNYHGFSANVVVPQSRAFHMAPAPQAMVRRAPVSISGVRVGVVVLEQMATTTMDIELHNPASRLQEAELVVPVPDGAVLKGFDFQGSGKEPSARLLPKAEAKRIYSSIVARVRDPALMEFIGYNLIRSSVFPVPARGSQKVRLTYEHLLVADGNRVDYLLPRSESLDYRVPWQISMQIKSKRKLATVYSPSHELDTVRRSDNQVSVKLSKQSTTTAGPFRLSYLLQSGDMSASLFAYPDPQVGGGYFLLLAGLPPRPAGQTSPAMKREITLVMDRSGSMNGKKLRQVKIAALQVLSGLEPDEAFNLIVYNEAVDVFSSQPVIKTEATMKKARQWIESIRSRGGTNIHDALVEALRSKPTQGMLPIVLFLTDGLPTIGQTSEKAIRRLAAKTNRAKRRIFTFGVGVDVNTPLLEKIATETRAFSTFVLPEEDVEVKVSKVFKGLSGPVLAEPVVSFAGQRGRVRDLLPARLPDLYEGDQLVLLGNYLGERQLTFLLKGNHLGKSRTFKFSFDMSKATTRNGFVPRLWASRKIGVLVDEIRSSGADVDRMNLGRRHATDPKFKELVDEIVRLSTEFGILTEYTAFLAREGTDLGQRDQVMLQAQGNFQKRAVRTRSGLSSVNQEMNYQAQSRQQVLNPYNKFYDANMNRVSVSTVQQVGDRAFYRRGSRWVDSRVVNQERSVRPTQTITFGSKEFRQLAERLAKEGRQGSISLQGDILMVVDGKPILIKGPSTP